MLQILILSANPVDVRYLSVDQEYHRIYDALKNKHEVDIKYWPATSSLDFPRKINEHRPDVLHFSGHASSIGNLVFQKENDKPEEVGKDPITTVLEILGNNLRCITLNACYSQGQATEIIQKVDCVVIGMSEKVPDDVAVQFSESFYYWVGQGRSIGEAIKLTEYDIGNTAKVDVKCRPTTDINKIYLLKDPKSFVDHTNPVSDLTLLLEKVPSKISFREFWEKENKGNLRRVLQDLLDKGELTDNEQDTVKTALYLVPVKLGKLEELGRFYSKKNSDDIEDLQVEVLSIYGRMVELIRRIYRDE